MDYQGYEEFESELGDIAITDSHVERENRESESWEKIKENFSSEELVDNIHFSKIQSLGFRPGSMFPHILIKVEDSWRRMFMAEGDDAHKCFKMLRYRWNSYCQNHQ
jgi:hypothetical protein